MEVIILEDAEQVAEKAAEVVCRMVACKPAAVLGLASGSTPVGLYRRLVARHRDGQLSFAEVTTFNLDEYIGLAPDSPRSYRSFMARELFDHIDIAPQRTHLPACAPGQDPRAVGPAYEALMAAHGGIDLQVLGIGGNGHIGFNEPSSSLASRTRVKTLTRRTVEDNRRLFEPDEFQPSLAVTMGISTIMEARRVLLLATGQHKAAAVQAAIEGAISAMHPASVLQAHPRVRCVLDEAAASGLQLREYYDWVYRQAESIERQYGAQAPGDPWFL